MMKDEPNTETVDKPQVAVSSTNWLGLRTVCEECGWRGDGKDVLQAQNPFDKDDVIYGCPRCAEVNRIRRTCDADGCWDVPSMGTPTIHGYRHTCWKHRPHESEQT